jgi:colicin import membrane protein
MVASGLILGTFTLHGYFDPQWQERQLQAVGAPARVTEPWATSTRAGNAVVREPAVVAPKPPPQAAVKPAPKPDAAISDADAEAKAAAKAKRLAEKKRAEKKKAEEAQKLEKAKQAQQSQQTTFQWPWNLLGN